MKLVQRSAFAAVAALATCALLTAQGPGGGAKGGGKGGGKGAPRSIFWVTSPAWADGAEIPMKYSGRGDNKSPEFVFHWNLGQEPGNAPEALQSYAVVFHDIENSSQRTTVDTLHWAAFNIPASAKGLPEGLGSGDLPDGTRNGPGIGAGRGAPAYFGPGAGPGPIHHYVFEFYALDTKLDLPATTSRDELMKAMDGHVIGKAAYFGRFPAPGN